MSVGAWRAALVVTLFLLLLGPATARAQEPARLCRALLPVLVDAPADVTTELRPAAGDMPVAVRIEWRGTAPGDEPRGWLVCWLKEPIPGAWEIDAADTSRYGRLSRYDLLQASKLLRFPRPADTAPAPAPLLPLLHLVQQLINAFSLGCVYALIAVGYTLVYGITRVINFAYGSLYTIGAFVLVAAWAGRPAAAATPLVVAGALVLALATGAAFGWLMERMVFRPLRMAATSVPLIAAIGLAVALQEWVRLAQGPRTRYLLVADTAPWPLITGHGFDVFLSPGHLGVGLAALALGTGLWWLQRRTAFGRAQRACAQDVTMARLMGVDVDRTVALTFLLGGALAAAAGLFAAVQYGVVTFRMGALIGLKALTAAILGGIGSLPGAALGGILVAFAETLTAAYLASQWKDVAVFALLVLVLIFRPQGLLATPRQPQFDERAR
jgi:branched-chain amino acid transport system permease protein